MQPTNAAADPDVRPRKLRQLPPEDEIVISGIAGRFPESNNMKHLYDNLMSKTDLITADDRRWKLDHPEIPQRTGKINNIEKFDSLFFGVHFKQAHTMDPMCRMLLEHAYEAIIDAGVNPRKIRGSKTGVFMGACFSESEKTWFYDKLQVNGFGITGCARSMLSNRISYFLGLTGPSYTVDTACSSSLFAMEHAYRAIREGLCDAAIVGGANLCLHPYVSMQFFKLGVLSTDGRCKTFDEDADGYVRSESISVAFLQKAKDAKRIYATVVHGKINCDGFKEQGVTFPSSHMQGVLLKEFYLECGVPPALVGYVEAHGTGTRVGDPEEVNAIDAVFARDAKRRADDPLLIGSVKSNLGHSEPASGLVSISKVLLAMESGVIPPNINFNRAKEEIKSIKEGRIKVVTDATPWKGEFAGVNSFGFGGANAHVLLKRNAKQKVNGGQPKDDLPRLAVVSGRTDDAVNFILSDLESKPVDVEYVRLLHDIHSDDITNHLYRGYTVLPPRGISKFPIREIKSVSGTKRPVWFVFSGMGSQWPGMGEALLRIPVFAEAIKKCDAILKPRGIDIFQVITNKDKTTFDNILNSFVGIAAVQIGLVDILRLIGIEPDNIIGHSVGELGCAYADGCFTTEQMILAAYSRGLASIETKVIHGSMAAVGLGFKKLKPMCPPDIEVACHNASDSATISGPAESMKAFVAELQEKKIFAREVPCSNIPYHSRYIAPAGPKLLAYLQKVVPSPKQRSPKWVSTSVPMDKWDSPAARYSSAEYHTNNLLGAVLFEETSALIPKDAIAIEVAPHGLLQAILRRSLHPGVANIPLTQRGHEDNAQVLFQALGKMFNVGLHPQLDKLYPPIAYPVSRSTQMISPLIKWEHSEDWYVTNYKSQQNNTSGERIVKIALTDSDYEVMSGHVIDGRNLFPATGYLWLIWQTLGMMQGELYIEMSVVFEDVKFLRATQIPKSGEVEFTLMIQKGTGRFEVVEGGAAVVTGLVRSTTTPAVEKVKANTPVNEEKEVMSSQDIYKELRIRGYHYTGVFCSIRSSTASGLKGQIEWCNDWVAFMDNMLQMKILGTDTRGLFVPTGIKKLVIDTNAHLGQIKFGEQGKRFPVYVDKLHDTIVSGGVEIRGLKSSAIPRRKPAGKPILEEYKFVPFNDAAEVSLSELAKLVSHIALENHSGIKVKSVELIAEPEKLSPKDLLTPSIVESLDNMPLIQAEPVIFSTKSKFGEDFSLPPNVSVLDPKKASGDSNALIVIGQWLLTDDSVDRMNLLLSEVKPNGFILTRESFDVKNVQQLAQNKGLTVILTKKYEHHMYVLLRRQEKLRTNLSVVYVDNERLDWVDEMRKIVAEALKNDNPGSTRVYFVGQEGFENGLMGLINCLKLEPGGEVARGVLIQDPKAPKFDLQNSLYADQIKKDLVVNVLRDHGVWGSYRHLALPSVEPTPVAHGWINQTVRGDLSSLIWHEGFIKSSKETKNLVGIYYASINFKDVMLATGKLAVEVVAKTRLAAESVIGFEYSGIDSSGKRVMGMIECRGLSNLCIGDPDLYWQIPDGWTFEDAATVPCVYATCYYGLYLKGKMKKGDKVLIHAGTGGVGQAAINLALHEGCEVFTTVGTPEKRQFIRDHFPQIPDNHIGNSRDTSFEQMIKEQTNGRGVDIVLNSLSEEKLLASVSCLAWGGRFLEIGKFDLSADNPLGMECFLREISFQGIHVDRFMTADSHTKRELQSLMAPGLKNGAVKPLIRTVFPKDQVEAAFRYMAAGKHMGKVILKVREEKEPINTPVLAYPRYYCQSDRSYLILGGLGGFGLELADWLVLRGAKNLVLTSRGGIKNGYQTMRIELWKSYGVRVTVVVGKDASVLRDCQSILETASGLAPVDAIFNLAVVLNDSLWDNQTQESFRESLQSKAWSTKNLDTLSRKLCPVLRHFVVFSSVSCGRGNAGQTNYGMANSVMERICERRASEGLPALAVQWGAVGDVGLVAEMQQDHKELVIGGTLQQGIFSCLHELDGLLKQNRPVVSSMVVAEKKISGAGALSITDTVLNIMGLKDLKGVSPNASLAELGMDSMMSVEIKQTLEREFDVFLTAQDIRGLNFAKLQEMSEEAADAENAEQQQQQQQQNQNDGSGEDDEHQSSLRPAARLLGDGNVSLETCVKLRTKEEVGRSEIFLIPGVEGFASVFMGLASKIRPPATCLQLGIDNECRSIASMSDLLLPHVLERSKNRRDFTLVGYSYGSLLAIELARRLEERELSGQLILIDGAPEPVKLMQKCYTHNNSDQELQTKAILDIITVMSPAHASNLKTALEKCQKWEEKVEALIQICPPSKINMSDKNFRSLCKALYNRIIALTTYSTSNMAPIKAPITLLKPTIQSIQYEAEDYGLSQVTKSKVSVYTVPGNHVTMLDNDKIASAINGDDIEDVNAFKAEIMGKNKKF